jgi:hypothetical protein
VRTLWPSASPLAVAAALLVGLTALHAAGFRMSSRTQDALVAVKAALLVAFLAVGLWHAPAAWPIWQPPRPPASTPAAFATSLFFVSFAFSGWNAAVYATGEFREPRRDVPRAMLCGCALVALLYLGINWVFVASLTPEQAAVAVAYETHRVTLGHLVMRAAVGPGGAAAMSALTVVALVSSMSAMVFAGPRVYAAMAQDGYLPRALAGREGRPTPATIALQGALALAILLTHSLQEILGGLGAILMLFSRARCVRARAGPLRAAGPAPLRAIRSRRGRRVRRRLGRAPRGRRARVAPGFALAGRGAGRGRRRLRRRRTRSHLLLKRRAFCILGPSGWIISLQRDAAVHPPQLRADPGRPLRRERAPVHFVSPRLAARSTGCVSAATRWRWAP